MEAVESGITVHQLVKTFNHRPALKEVGFKVDRGEKVVIFGPNGAGKTTLLKILATVMKPSSGTVKIGGLDINKGAEQIRRQIGVVSHQSYLYSGLTAYENLEFYARLHDIADPAQRVKEMAELVGMTSRLYDRVDTFSRGMQQRISIARSLLHNPSVLLMDEPETGLDQQAIATLWGILHESGRTILLATHSLERGMEIADKVIILHKGKIALEAPVSELNLANCRQSYFELTGAKS
ncbi:MAG: ABC transporter ATP-binding protein [Dehalogenimonas sp.]